MVVAYSGHYKLDGARSVAVHRRGSRDVNNRKGRCLTGNVSETEIQ
jgi:hypothetical protein